MASARRRRAPDRYRAAKAVRRPRRRRAVRPGPAHHERAGARRLHQRVERILGARDESRSVLASWSICTRTWPATSRTTSSARLWTSRRDSRSRGRAIKQSPAWFDIGRELTEIWHHGAQIRDAVEAGPFPDPRWLRAVLDMAVRGLPHAYRNVGAEPGASIQLDITGPSGGTWMLEATDTGWDLSAGAAVRPGRRSRR